MLGNYRTFIVGQSWKIVGMINKYKKKRCDMRAQSALSNNKRHRTLKYNVKVLDKYQETRKPILMQPAKTAKSKPSTATSTILDFKTNNDIIVRPSTTQINRVRIPMNMQTFMKNPLHSSCFYYFMILILK